ncbi:MAG: iron-containing redox enzyme family protein [Pseudonocardiaceae bacterium]
MYTRAADPEALLSRGSVETIRTELGQTGTEGDLTELQRQATEWSRAESERFRDLIAEAGEDTVSVLVRRAALHCAPLALLSGAWLQWLSAPGNADGAVALTILTLYASDVDVGYPRASRGSAYLALLREMKLSDNAVPAARLSRDPRIGDGSFYLPAILLAMSRLPDDMRDEIVGADLCLRTVGLLPPLRMVKEHRPAAADWTSLDPAGARRPDQPAGIEQCRRALEAILADGADNAANGSGGNNADNGAGRIMAGFQWALAALRRWSGDVLADLKAARDPGYEFAELLRMRAREGAVYHQDYTLGDGWPLAHWLQEARTEPAPLMAALATSRLVKPGRPDRSPLVNSLVGEGGRMFRVFTSEDLAVIRRWIAALPEDGHGAGEVPSPPAAPAYVPALDTAPETGIPPADVREAYHQLVNRTDTRALRHWARAYVYGWLARTRHDVEGAEFPLPRCWTPEGLRPWLGDMHDRHNEGFEHDTAPTPSRDALIDSTVQLAPLTLIDGSWIAGFSDYEHASSEIGHSLFETYWDELGNGEERLNHPLIYREMLAEMAADPPPTASREFARWQRFRDVSFELPVYWLAIGRFPQTFMPEVLGLNLAMELSGVGGTYRRAHIALKAHGFSARFVDIHNTIDNVASGHSAWAADAVDTYLAGVLASQGSEALDTAWERVRIGYRSLNPSSARRARAAARRATRRASRQPVLEGVMR